MMSFPVKGAQFVSVARTLVVPFADVRFNIRLIVAEPHTPIPATRSSSSQITSVPLKAIASGLTTLDANTVALPPEAGILLRTASPVSDQYKFPLAEVSDAGDVPVTVTTAARLDAA